MILKILVDIIGIAGLASLSYGAMLIYFPLVFILPGIFALLFALKAST